jgi:hypothetical protein
MLVWKSTGDLIREGINVGYKIIPPISKEDDNWSDTNRSAL